MSDPWIFWLLGASAGYTLGLLTGWLILLWISRETRRKWRDRAMLLNRGER